MSLRTNLATRPFYNVRAVQAILLAAVVLVLAFTAFNAYQLLTLAGSQSRLGAQAAEAEESARRYRGDAARMRTQINQKELELVSERAREANAIIDRRAFSWTDLFTLLEATLPDDVRITTIQPRFEKEGKDTSATPRIGIIAVARRAEDIADFIEALEKTGAFLNVVPLQQNVDDRDGSINVALDGEYHPRPRPVEATPEPSATPKPAPPVSRSKGHAGAQPSRGATHD